MGAADSYAQDCHPAQPLTGAFLAAGASWLGQRDIHHASFMSSVYFSQNAKIQET